MGDGDDAVAAGATEQVRADTTAGLGRRRVTRGLLSCFAALSLAPVVAASRPVPPAVGGGSVDETYRGRRIQGVRLREVGRSASEDAWRITVDGRPLHLMRRADGTWLSMVDHYTSYRTPLEAARAAVDELGPGQELRDLAPGPLNDTLPGGAEDTRGHMGMTTDTGMAMAMGRGGRHGVRA
ncbi:tyrosinase family oxidase copper chaperone [Streptomyces sp. NPDC048106]|uniref:tyrosinase family oxidase copper chaperone n=1 Tax=Streptomyces sp. NPDC048106 TaxID=3155750 RepID=UPI00345439D6